MVRRKKQRTRFSIGALVGWGAAAFGIAVLSIVLVLWAEPPELIRIGAAYSAKIVCSNVFLAGRDPDEVLATDVQAPGHPLLKLMRVSVDRSRGVVRAGLLGFIGGGVAELRSDAGCVVIPVKGGLSTAVIGAAATRAVAGGAARAHIPWPDGEEIGSEPAMERVLDDDALAGPGMRAIVVVHRGQLVAERYGRGFGIDTPQLGWPQPLLRALLDAAGTPTPASGGRGGSPR